MHFNPYFIMSLSIDININAFQFYLLYNKEFLYFIFGKNNKEGGRGRNAYSFGKY